METIATETITVINPISGQKIYSFEEPSDEELKRIFNTAREMQPIIRAMSIEDRIKEVDKIKEYVLNHADFIMQELIAETGKVYGDGFPSEIFEVCNGIEVYKKLAPKILKDQNRPVPIFLMGKKAQQWREPMGTIMIISPWNFPFNQVIIPSVMAFLAGNAVIVKPSEVTPLRNIWKHFYEHSGFMKDALQVVVGGKSTGAKLLQMRPDKVHFTGSVKSGKKVMSICSEQLIPIDLELGGKDPAIVFDDINFDRTVNGIMWGAFTNAGQNCTGIERLYVQEGVYDKFMAELVDKTKKLRASHPDRKTTASEDVDVGAVTSAFQVRIIEEHIQDALNKGARLLCGGIQTPGSHHIPPTIFDNCNDSMKIATEETFGPTLAVMKFKTEEEVIQLANNSPYGLGASVWTSDMKRGERVARALVTGNVCINNHLINEANPYLPFGGIKDSGFGRFKGEEGLLTFSNLKSVIIEKQSDLVEPHWYPYTKEKSALLRNLMEAYFRKSKNWIKFAINGLQIDTIGKKQKLK